MSPMGSFGNFGSGSVQQSTPSEKRPGLGSGRAESRFKNILNNGEDAASPSVQRKASMSSLSRVNENESWRLQEAQEAPLAETDEDRLTGSAALAAESDLSPPHQRQGFRGFGTPSRSGTQDEFGFAAFGMTSDNTHGFGPGLMQGRDAFQQQRSGQPMGGNEPMSPTDTNPYQSPEQRGVEHLAEEYDADDDDMQSAHLPGLGGFGNEQAQQLSGLGSLGALPNFPRGNGAQGGTSDRSQTSSVGANRGFASLGGLGQLGSVPGAGAGAWPVTQPGFGTPGRQPVGLSSAFGGGIFATSVGDMQSPGLPGLAGPSVLSPQSSAGFGGSRMASMFPAGMQEQMKQSDHGLEQRDMSVERPSQLPFGAMGGDLTREESSYPAGFGGPQQRAPEQQDQQFGSLGQQQLPIGQSTQPQSDQQSQQPPQPPGSSASNQPPAPQQRTMVMPDRMRWIYRDPQGQTQGPWSGLEMHDWYKAGFFSPELLVKKFEDPDYEPLAQLIRRIGNSREPFLVPQIGIPHGAPSNNGPSSFLGAGTVPAPGGGPTSSSGAQPPFASSFPSFGTTLTADQQNALERRKQEEQYLMARQKEHLAQAQIASRIQMQGGGAHHSNLMPGAGGSLHHHSSAQSLHSQPSFGSISSPTATYQQSPTQGPTGSGGHVQGFFDNSFRSPQSGGLGAVGAGVDSLGHIREEEIPGIMDRLDIGARQAPGQFGAPGQQTGQDGHPQQVHQMLQDRARLQQEQAQHDAMQQQRGSEQPMPNERLQQFQHLQGQAPLDARFAPAMGKQIEQASAQQSSIGSPLITQPQQQQHLPQEPLSLTEQVQQAASAQQSPAPQQIGLPQPFPPAPSQSPLPAPAAQRTGRLSVADQLQTESRDLSETPSTETPSAAIAPWAKEPAEAPRGPSLKEIQQAEAKKAAEAEELASAARRAAFQREMEVQAQVQAQAAVPQPGLPASASWGATASPSTPTGANVPAAWVKAAQKPTGAPAKTMAQIQKEEESRKKKMAAAVAAANATATGSVASPVGSKSYANLAGKVTAPAAATKSGAAWTTVGASGKVKAPAVAPAAPGLSPAVVSSNSVPTVQAKKIPSRTSTLTHPGAVNAQEEFRKWAIGELRPDLNKGISGKQANRTDAGLILTRNAVDDFVATLVFLPAELGLITEAVHGVSSTIDSRHFAEEFIRRKKLADKGLIEPSTPLKSASPHNATSHQGGGWSEVAKKGPVKEPSKDESNGSFRVVASKKKAGKR